MEQKKKIPARRVIRFLKQVASGLEYAHKHGVIHRDINPTNLFIMPDERVKIIDFGLACPIGMEDIDALGTLAYVAPEQIEAETVDQRTDIYALGITAYEMVTGSLPFPDKKAGALIRSHLEKDIPDPSVIVPELPDNLRRFIMTSSRRNPEERYPDMARALDDLAAGRHKR